MTFNFVAGDHRFMIVCHCAAVSDSTLDRVIREGASTVREVTRRCGAGTCCAPCRQEIAAMLYAVEAERQNPSGCGAPSDRRAA